MSVQVQDCPRWGEYLGQSNNLSPNGRVHQGKNLPNEQMYYNCPAKQASDYEALTEFLNNCIQQNFEFGDYIANAIVNQKLTNTDIQKPIIKKEQQS